MNCDFSEKVSMLIDRELSPSEADLVRKHLAECGLCRQVEQDFLGLRNQIKSFDFDTDPIAQRQTLWKVLASRSIPFWRKKIKLPVPVFALAVAALLAFGAWSVYVRTVQQARVVDKRVRNVRIEPTSNIDPGVLDLSRYDRGERAILYKERLSDKGREAGKGSSR